MTTLYRKYRPQSFGDLVNQNHIKITLQNEIERNQVSHAYLFTGPRGIGKTTTARILAKAVNCEKRQEGKSEPCNKCAACEEITAGRSLDIVEIDAASHTGVDNVRENIIENSRVAPSILKYKVFIIDEAHMLSTQAFNALLKTLEEPPSNVIFILATTEVHKIPLTIVSRTERFDFKKINLKDLVKRLEHLAKEEGIMVSGEALLKIASHSEGSLRDAESMLGQILSLVGEGKQKKDISEEFIDLVIPRSDFVLVLELIKYLADKKTKEALILINRLVNEGLELKQFNTNIIEFLRKILLVKISGELRQFSYALDNETEEELERLAGKFSLQSLLSAIDIFIERSRGIKPGGLAQLTLEMAAVEICERRDDGAAPSEEPPAIIPADLYPRGNREKVPAKNNFAKKKSLDSESNKPQKFSVKNNNLKVAIDDIRLKWKEVLKAIQAHNNSLPFVMRVSKPLELEGNLLKIGFAYALHQERANEPKSREIIKKVLKDVFGENLEIEGVVADKDEFLTGQENGVGNGNGIEEGKINQDNTFTDEKEILEDVLKEFGGKVVE